MADTTISQLSLGTPNLGAIIPFTDGTFTYQAKLSSLITATGSMGNRGIQLPVGTTAQRPISPSIGTIRLNSTIGTAEWYDGIRWSTDIGYIDEILIVAGGGGGGPYIGGGGGGGGVIFASGSFPVYANDPKSITVGSGGIYGGASPNSSSNGQNSSAFGYTAIGGGFGGTSEYSGIVGSGGSGGGGGRRGGGRGVDPGSGTAGQGYMGGYGSGSGGGDNLGAGAGGGGAGAVGNNASGGAGGSGGVGLANSITGLLNYYGGGGGGGAYYNSGGSGGAGGGGNAGGNSSTPGANGTANTGGGGGAGGYGPSASNGGNGGSGVVIIAYKGTTARATGGSISTTSRPGYVVHTFTSGTNNFTWN